MLLVGTSYALFRANLLGSKINSVGTERFELHFKEGNELNVVNMYKSDEEAIKEVPYFEFTIEGKYQKGSSLDYTIYLEEISKDKDITLESVKLNLKKIVNNKEQEVLKTTKISELEKYKETDNKYSLYSDTMTFSKVYSNPKDTYRLRSWINEQNIDLGNLGEIDGPIVIEPKSYKFRINVEAGNIEEQNVNAPILLDNMIPVIYDEEKESWIKTTTDNWYNYDKKQWANAITIDNTKAYDLSKNKNHVPITGPTKVSNGLKFDGKDDYIDIGFANKEFTNGFTMNTKFIFTEQPVNSSNLFSNIEAGGSLIYVVDNTIKVDVHDGTGYINIGVTGPIELNKEYEVIVTFDNTDGNFYLNGKLIGSHHWDTPTKMKISSAPFTIGAEPDAKGGHNFYANAIIQEARLYERALSLEEVTKLYNNEEVSDKGLLSYYNFVDEFKPGQEIDMKMINTMWVWIPRYKYRIFNANLTGGETANEQEIEITFEKGKETTGTVKCVDSINKNDGTSETCDDKFNNGIKNGVSTYTHPAFTFGGEELTGFWYGKFEDGIESSQFVIKPDVAPNNTQDISTRFQKIREMELQNNIYGFLSNATAYTDTGDLTGDNNNFDTHLTKNIEWGAVAYLTHSKYGRCNNGACSEVYANNTKAYTGRSSGIVSSETTSSYGSYSYDDYIVNESNVKTSKVIGKGTGASTTGNIYGIYDMSGGLYENTMGIMIPADNSFETVTKFKSNLNKKYYDSYSWGTTVDDVTSYKRGKLGDATKEIIKRLDNSNKNGWYGGKSSFVTTASWNRPFFIRSKTSNSTANGVLSFASNGNSVWEEGSFRSALVIY